MIAEIRCSVPAVSAAALHSSQKFRSERVVYRRGEGLRAALVWYARYCTGYGRGAQVSAGSARRDRECFLPAYRLFSSAALAAVLQP